MTDTPEIEAPVEASQESTIAARIAREMARETLVPLTAEQAEARETWLAEVRMCEQLEREAEAWHRQQILEERQRLAAEAEERARLERVHQHQRETAARLQQQQAARDAAEAARAASDTRASLARQEAERRQRAIIEQRAQIVRGAISGLVPPQPDPVLERLDEIAAKLDPPEPTLHERLTDPRRFKFDWQP